METPPLRSCSIEQARVMLPDVMHRVAYLGEHVEIYRCGERLGVIIPVDLYQNNFISNTQHKHTLTIPTGDTQ